ncbi:hypothetical protein ACKWTF_005058 [Chironomus riparius]
MIVYKSQPFLCLKHKIQRKNIKLEANKIERKYKGENRFSSDFQSTNFHSHCRYRKHQCERNQLSFIFYKHSYRDGRRKKKPEKKKLLFQYEKGMGNEGKFSTLHI